MSEKLPVAMTVAGLAMGLCALAGIAYYMGWGPFSRPPEIALAPRAAPAAAAKAPSHPDVPLLPGESLVSPPDPVAAPAPAPPIPAPAPAPAAKKPSPPQYTKPPERKPAPVVAKRPPPPRPQPETSFERSARSVCGNCGVVTGMTRHDYDWEVRVRFDDGTRKALRSYDRPRVEIGDSVHLEDGRLVRD